MYRVTFRWVVKTKDETKARDKVKRILASNNIEYRPEKCLAERLCDKCFIGIGSILKDSKRLCVSCDKKEKRQLQLLNENVLV